MRRPPEKGNHISESLALHKGKPQKFFSSQMTIYAGTDSLSYVYHWSWIIKFEYDFTDISGSILGSMGISKCMAVSAD